MKVCFIGNCGHSKNAYRVLKERNDVILCGMAPGSEHENLTAAFDETIPFFESYEKMLDQTAPDLAVVSPVFGLTGRVIIACADRGIDVFSEKPVASSMEELQEVKAAIEKSGIRFCAMHYLRCAPAFYHAAEMVRAGAIGELRLITAQKSYRFGTRPSWYSDRSLYGGTIPWIGIHAIDWIAAFSGKKFLSVDAQSFGSPEMAAICRFEMEDGLMASVNLDYYRPAKAPSHDDDRIRCAGTSGVIEVRERKIYLMNDNGVQIFEPTEAPELLTSFLDGQPVITPEEIFEITKVSLAAREAADFGQRVAIGGNGK